MADNSIIKDDQNLGIENSTSETLATQGNVINSLKSFWVKLRAKLNLAVTRDTSKAIGSEYIPVYVNQDGEVKECNTEIINITSVGNGSLTNNTIKLNANNINPSIKITVKPVTGTMICLSLPNYSSDNTIDLRIQDGNNVSSLVYYNSGISVQVKDLAGQAAKYLLVYSKEDIAGRWVILNSINTVKGSNANSSNPTGSGGKAGLMSADDKAKLDSIQWGAKSSFDWGELLNIPNASRDARGLVKLGANGNININDNKVYPVQVDNDGHMGVSVPWQNDDTHYTGNLIVSNDTTSAGVAVSSGNDNTYIGYVENNIRQGTNAQIKGTGGATVSSDNGVITINAEQYIVQKPTVTVETITRNNSGSLAGTLTFKDSSNTNVNVKVIYGGTPRGAESYLFNLNQLQVTASTSNNEAKTYYIPFYPKNRTDILPGLVKLTIRCTVGGSEQNPSYSYEAIGDTPYVM